MTRPFRERFLDNVCAWDGVLSIVFTMNVVFLVLLGLSFWLSTPSEESRVISLLALGFILVSLAVVTPLLRACRTRETVDVDATDDGS